MTLDEIMSCLEEMSYPDDQDERCVRLADARVHLAGAFARKEAAKRQTALFRGEPTDPGTQEYEEGQYPLPRG